MDEDSRTIYCGNLSSQCTEEILYELFMQAGPLEKVNIPKDRDGNTKTFGFITFKHKQSVPYAVELFEGTNLYNRQMSIKPRQSEQNPNQSSHPFMNMQQNMNDLLKYGNQILMGYQMPNYGSNFNMIPPLYMPPGVVTYPTNQIGHYTHGKLLNSDRHSSRNHPYNRDRERHRDRDSQRDRYHERGHGNHHHHHHQQSSNRDNRDSRDNRDNRSHRSANHHKSERNYR